MKCARSITTAILALAPLAALHAAGIPASPAGQSPNPTPTQERTKSAIETEVDVAGLGLGSSARASSVYGPTYAANNAIDGRWSVEQTDKWNSAQGAPGPHWLVIDLGAERIIHKVVIYHEGVVGDGEAFNTRDFQIQRGGGPDGTWTDLVPPVRGNEQDVTVHPFAPTPLRYLRLLVTRGERDGNAYARIYEVQLFAKTDTLPPAVRDAALALAGKLNNVHFPDYFQPGHIGIISASHQDIAWMNSIDRCVEQRDEEVISPALKLLWSNPAYRYSVEDTLSLMEYLGRHPDRKGEISNFMREGRLEWGGTYNLSYESLYAGESLVRQTYYGRRWIEKTLPGCDTVTAFSPEPPARALQMPQILARSGIKYLLVSRLESGYYDWQSPDGSSVRVWSPGHYAAQRALLQGSQEKALNALATEMQKREPYYQEKHVPPIFPCYVCDDSMRPTDFSRLILGWPVSAPTLGYMTIAEMMNAVAAGKPDIPRITGERPNVWVYIHGPTHHLAVSAMREAAGLLPAAETFAAFNALLAGSFASYPSAQFDEAWKAHIYPDHGWGGYYGELTDQTFLEKEEFACDSARRILDGALSGIAGRVKTEEKLGEPVVVFNPLSWQRSDPVTIDRPAARIVDATGREVPSQWVDGGKRMFIAAGVPALGYRTFYAQKERTPVPAVSGASNSFENAFYRITLTGGGVHSIYDRQLGKELLRGGKFLGGELFTMQSNGNGAGEFTEVQQPTMEMWENVGRYAPPWKRIESGPVRTVFELVLPQREQKLRHCSLQQQLIVYETIKRIDFEVSLIGWDGTPMREFRLAFPINMDRGQVSYEVPMGVVEVGKSELAGAAGDMYKQLCRDVRPREVQNWIDASGGGFGVTLSSDVAVCDYVDPTDAPVGYPVLQPILLASRRSCHGWGNWYLQPGDHHYRFSLTSHAGGWQNGWRAGIQANRPLLAVVGSHRRADASLPAEKSFLGIDAPNVMVTTVKKCEDNSSLVVRCVEMEGKDTAAQITLPLPVSHAEEVNLIEEGGKPLRADDRTVPVQIGHNAIETVKLSLGKP